MKDFNYINIFKAITKIVKPILKGKLFKITIVRS